MSSKARKAKPNEADAHAFFSYCIQVTALLAEEYCTEGQCDPALVASLRHMQMVHDRQVRKLSKAGITPTIANRFAQVPSYRELQADNRG